MPIITKTNKKFIDFLNEVAHDLEVTGQTNIQAIQERYNVSDKFVQAVFYYNIIKNVGSTNQPVYIWNENTIIDRALIISLRLSMTKNN